MIIEARDISKIFSRTGVIAVDHVSLSIKKGQTLGVVGESGSGKSTLAKLLLRLLPIDGGHLYFEGSEISHSPEKDLKEFRQKVQVVFQEPFLSLDPRMSVGDILKEPFQIQKKLEKRLYGAKVKQLLHAVELPPDLALRLPHQLSGGECQRVAVARAISTDPELIVCDEAVSSLDVLVQAGILNLFLKLQKERRVSYLFISHDLKVVRHMSDEILVMKEGRVCESGLRDEVLLNPEHPYTKLLIQKALL